MEKIEAYRDSRGDLHLTKASAERAETRYVLENEVNAYIRANEICGVLFAARYHNLSV